MVFKPTETKESCHSSPISSAGNFSLSATFSSSSLEEVREEASLQGKQSVQGQQQCQTALSSSYPKTTTKNIRQTMPNLKMLMLCPLMAALLLASSTMAQETGKCYSFAPGLTIPGADYRRDYGLSRRQCADVCKSDICCMAFEWRRTGGQCTLKSRSLNGTVTQVPVEPEPESEPEVEQEEEVKLVEGGVEQQQQKKRSKAAAGSDLFFALCLDYGDSERDRFWDHELGGPVVASAEQIGREKCAKFCSEFSAASVAAAANTQQKQQKRAVEGDEVEEQEEKEQEENNQISRGFGGLFTTRSSIWGPHHAQRRTKRRGEAKNKSAAPSATAPAAAAVIYNWRTSDPEDMESPLGHCQCISVLQHIRLSFGSFAGFLI